mmetsp:Transcript_14569/g.38970  ORF Transcript_14569/g.38970 Transcript_14569/m.38970 type:complete len:145 (+) Transcript_14569:427-861(+)
MLLHPFSMFSKQQLFRPHPLEQIAEASMPGTLPGVALQHPRGHASSTVPAAQNPFGWQEPEQIPSVVQSRSLEQGFVHAQRFFLSGRNPVGHETPAHAPGVSVGCGLGTASNVAVPHAHVGWISTVTLSSPSARPSNESCCVAK